MLKLILILLVLIAGCERSRDWQKYSKEYFCTPTQWKYVHAQTIRCDQSTDYSKNYCYNQAIRTNCSPKKGGESLTDDSF